MVKVRKKRSRSVGATVFVGGNRGSFVRQRDGRKKKTRPEEDKNRDKIKERLDRHREEFGEDEVYRRGVAHLEMLESGERKPLRPPVTVPRKVAARKPVRKPKPKKRARKPRKKAVEITPEIEEIRDRECYTSEERIEALADLFGAIARLLRSNL